MEETLYYFLLNSLNDSDTSDLGIYNLKELTPYMTVLTLSEKFANTNNGVNCIHFYKNECNLLDVEYLFLSNRTRSIKKTVYNLSEDRIIQSLNDILGVSL